MRKSGIDTESSMELLLDTICNMFGGIVLVFILLAVVSQLSGTGAPPPPPAQEDEGIPREQWERQGREIDALTNDIAVLARTTGLDPTPPEEAQDIDWHKILSGVQARQKEAGREYSNAVAVLLQQSNRLARSSATIRKAPPIEKEAKDLSQVFVAVKNGRFYAVNDVSAETTDRAYDQTQITVVRQPDLSVLLLFPIDKGQSVGPGCERAGPLRDALAHVKAEKEYFHFIVYPDSFAEFNYVKEAVISRGFRYTWSPVEAGLTVRIVPQGMGAGGSLPRPF